MSHMITGVMQKWCGGVIGQMCVTGVHFAESNKCLYSGETQQNIQNMQNIDQF